ncbi:MAG: ribosome-associated translation inhibitor RaiA [Bdellovibrionota bacterium]
MNLQISFKHVDTSDALRTYTAEKCQTLKKYFEGKISVTWNFSIERMKKVAHCHLVGNRMDYFGEAETDDFHASIDQALEKIERQVRKHKEITKDRLHKTARNNWKEIKSEE